MTLDATHTVGTLNPQTSFTRDAVHCAVLLVEAQNLFKPGDHAGKEGTHEMPIGIVDPFLEEVVSKGQKFWLFLYPRTITGLTHQWTHPDVPEGATPPSLRYEDAKAWIEDYADELGTTYDVLMSGADKWIKDGSYLSLGGTLEGQITRLAFWDKYQVVRGLSLGFNDYDNFFTCSC